MENKEIPMNSANKNCGDCLHCKVSAKSKIVRLCYCNKTKVKERHKETYWLEKPVCRKFEDMSE